MATATACENCGRTMGKLEEKHVWRDEHVVCGGCLATLKQSAASAEAAEKAETPNEDPTGVCTNCGTRLGQMEEPKFWKHQHLVCHSCYARLAGPVPATAPVPVVQRVEIVNARRGPSAGRIGYRIITGALFVAGIVLQNGSGAALFGLLHCLSYLPTKRERESRA